MSTRANIHFKDNYSDVCVYQHSDGYPEGEHGIIAELNRFFDWNEGRFEGGIGGLRYNDPEYLAARFIVFMATVEMTPWNGLSIAVSDGDHGDIAFRYVVGCETEKRPYVSFTS